MLAASSSTKPERKEQALLLTPRRVYLNSLLILHTTRAIPAPTQNAEQHPAHGRGCKIQLELTPAVRASWS